MQIQQFSNLYNRLSMGLLQHSVNANPGGNVVISPLSILQLLCIAADSTSGQTRSEILSALSDDPAADSFRTPLVMYQSALTATPSFFSANVALVRKTSEISIHPNYQSMLQTVYEGDCFVSQKLENQANQWISRETKGMIPCAIKNISSEIELLLLNAVAFEGVWPSPYSDHSIYPADFHNADGSIVSRLMLNDSEFSYIENDEFIGFTKNYSCASFSFMALLPRRRLRKISGNTLTNVNFSELFNSQTYQRTLTKAPEFTFSFDSPLVPFCKGHGIKTIFTDQADFSPMTDYPLKASSLMHKAFIGFDRFGTRAAALSFFALAAGCAPSSVEEPKQVYLTRPFIFAIIHQDTSLPVFTGVVNQLD